MEMWLEIINDHPKNMVCLTLCSIISDTCIAGKTCVSLQLPNMYVLHGKPISPPQPIYKHSIKNNANMVFPGMLGMM